MMRFIFITKATKFSEAGVRPSKESVDAMNAFHEELAAAGVLQSSEHFYPSSSGLRISYNKLSGEPKFIPGPLNEVNELTAGYTIIDVNSREEALKWAKRMPDPSGYGDGVIELRQLFDHSAEIQDAALEYELLSHIDMLKRI
ncbi:YciI family protein [Paenibacillus dakarensis]|uniref:YciI family protein n=1 Tax=Paenibacillus dakarensis TaxID=1527293 RepID=UPI001FE20CA1|nr:YciI family protein [Paenibacillus dakarensis]